MFPIASLRLLAPDIVKFTGLASVVEKDDVLVVCLHAANNKHTGGNNLTRLLIRILLGTSSITCLFSVNWDRSGGQYFSVNYKLEFLKC